LTPGDYYVEFVLPSGYVFSPQDQGLNDAVDSDANPLNGRTATFTLASGQTDTTLDAGMYETASIGDFVWEDLDGDGIQDAGEPSIQGVTVNLYCCLGLFVDTTTTDANGFYSFTGLTPGDYYVEFVLPSGYAFSPQDVGTDDTVDSDADSTTGLTVVTTLDFGESDLTWDAGMYEPASIGDFVWDDVDRDGIQDAGEVGIESVEVNLYDGSGNLIDTTTTDANGYYSFAGLAPGDYYIQFARPSGYVFSPQDQGTDDTVDSDADSTGKTATFILASGQTDTTLDAGMYETASIGDFVWEDLDGDGVQDAGEPGLPGVVVNLYDSAHNPVDTTITDIDGFYQFIDVVPGDYYLEFVLPAGYVFSPQDQTVDTVDSDADTTTGKTATITLTPGETDNTWDAGMYAPLPPVKACIGDRVWEDVDGDGVQDAGEPGISGVIVKLYRSDDTFVAFTVTDANGLYSFIVDPGDYYLEFVLPAGYAFSPQDQTLDSLDSDPDPSTGKTGVISLVSGETDITLDAGMVGPISPPVGGVWVPIDKFELMAPWISLASLITVAAVSIAYVKHKRHSARETK